MVIGHYVTVRADDHSRAAALAFPALRLGILVAEEEAEERIVYLRPLIGLGHGHFHIHDCFHRGLGRIGEVRIITLLIS